MSRNTHLDHTTYDDEEFSRPTTAPAHQSTSIIKYTTPRPIGLNLSNNFHGSLRNFALSTVESNLIAPPVTTNYGLVSLVETSAVATISPLTSIDGDLIVHENRELSKLHDKLADNILLSCYYDVYNRAEELQLDTLQKNSNKNTATIEKMFQGEMKASRQLIEDASRYKPDLKKKLDDIHQATLANDEHYQKLLAKRNAANKEIFDFQRKLAQNRAELEFLRWRMQFFTDEINFYTLKNNALQARQTKLRYELDEEIFAKQVLKMESEVLANEKITNEDLHLSNLDDARRGVDFQQIATSEAANQYREQLKLELRRMRKDYEKKLITFRDELHRKFDLEYHRYRIHKSIPAPTESREYEQTLEQIKQEKRKVEQDISSAHERNCELQGQIEALEKRIIEDRLSGDQEKSMTQRIAMLHQVIREREKQLKEANRTRKELKRRIDNFQELTNRYPRRILDNLNETELPRITAIDELKMEDNQALRPLATMIPSNPPPHQSTVRKSEELLFEEDTYEGSKDFNVEQDCNELFEYLNVPNVDEMNIIKILGHRNNGQRLRIRDEYKRRFHRYLDDDIETKIHGNAKSIFKSLLLSPIERDCCELQKILTETKTDTNMLIGLLLGHSNREIRMIMDTYERIFKTSLERDIIGNQDTPSKQIIRALLDARRSENEIINNDEVIADARNLYETSSRWRRDGLAFISLLSHRSNEYLKQVFDTYQQFNGIDIEQSIQTDKDPELSRTLMAIVRFVRNPARFFAYELKKTFKGVGTNEDNLTRIIVSRFEIDIMEIKILFEDISKRTLFDHIQTDTSGSYKRILLELIRQRVEPIRNNSAFKGLLEASLAPKTNNRPSVRWKEPISTQSYGRSRSTQDISNTNQFDRNNEGKRNTLSRLNIHSSDNEQYSLSNRSYSFDNDDE